MQEINIISLLNGLQAAQKVANKNGKKQVIKILDYAEKPKTGEKTDVKTK